MSATNGTATTKYSLAMIVRNCAKELETALKSFAAYPDEIVVVNTGIDENEPGFIETNKVAESFGAKIFHFPWVEDFSAARNFSFSKCSNDIVMWLDADDIVDNPRGFNQAIRKVFGEIGCECLYAEYLYEFDERGNCTTVLTRERVVDRRCFEWRAPIHEVMCENFHSRGQQLPPQLGRVKHNRKRGDKEQQVSLERNLRVIEYHYLPVEKGGKGEYCEERMVFYWANTLMGLKRYEEALKKYLEYVPRSGSNAEVQQALGNASECCRLIGRYPEAKALAYQAIERNPNAPTPYWFLAQANLASGNDELALNFAMSCLERGNKMQQEMVANPTVIFGGSALMAATINYRLNRPDEVEPLLNIAAKYFGENEVGIKEMRANLAIHKETNRVVEAYATLYRKALEEGRHEDLKKLAQAAPDLIRERHEVARHLPKQRPAGKRSIAFFCGGGMAGGWSPKLLETGMGGSEEAVCYLSDLFAKAGWHVEVYAPCEGRRAWNGVEWYPIEYFSGEDDGGVDVLVIWRNPMNLLDFGVKAKRTYLWLHDMPNMATWMPGIWNGFDGIFVLSEFHKKVHGFVPDEKLIVSANGIPVEKLPPVESLANEPLRMVYASDPARGLETVLDWWEYIRSKVPDAKLDIFYGFHPTFEDAAKHRTPHGRFLTGIKKRVTEKAQQPGIAWHGFVGHDKLHGSFAKTGLWLYPTAFPEISCITAMKIQSLGCIPVTVDAFALSETVKYGEKVPLAMDTAENQAVWADRVVAQALHPVPQETRNEMAVACRKAFDWSHVRDQWVARFEADLAKDGGDRFYPRNRMDLIRAS